MGPTLGNVYLFGQCYNMRDTATCEVPTDHHPLDANGTGCGSEHGAEHAVEQHATNTSQRQRPASPTASTTSANNKNAAANADVYVTSTTAASPGGT